MLQSTSVALIAVLGLLCPCAATSNDNRIMFEGASQVEWTEGNHTSGCQIDQDNPIFKPCAAFKSQENCRGETVTNNLVPGTCSMGNPSACEWTQPGPGLPGQCVPNTDICRINFDRPDVSWKDCTNSYTYTGKSVCKEGGLISCFSVKIGRVGPPEEGQAALLI